MSSITGPISGYGWPTYPRVYGRPNVGGATAPVVMQPRPGPVVPGSVIPPVPATAPVAPPNASGITKFLTSLRDPRIISLLLSTAQGLSQPRGPGVTGASQIINAIANGYRGLSAANVIQSKQAEQYRNELALRQAQAAGVQNVGARTGLTKQQTALVGEQAKALPKQLELSRDRLAETAREFNIGNSTKVLAVNKQYEAELGRLAVAQKNAETARMEYDLHKSDAAALERYNTERLKLDREQARFAAIQGKIRLTIAQSALREAYNRDPSSNIQPVALKLISVLSSNIYRDSQISGAPMSIEQASKVATGIVNRVYKNVSGKSLPGGTTDSARRAIPGVGYTVDLNKLNPNRHGFGTITVDQFNSLTPEQQKAVLNAQVSK